jgi:hypothetical protein
MSSNSVHYFIRNILQNSKLNREKFVKNKKLYNEKLYNQKNKRNYNLILKRKFNTNYYGLPPPNFNNNNNNNNIIYMIAAALGTYIFTGRFVNKKK